MTPRLRLKYKNEIIKNLMSKLNLKNSNSVPKIEKVILNMGLGADALDKKKLETCIKDMAAISGQYPSSSAFGPKPFLHASSKSFFNPII